MTTRRINMAGNKTTLTAYKEYSKLRFYKRIEDLDINTSMFISIMTLTTW